VKYPFDIAHLAQAIDDGLRTRVPGVPPPDRIRRRIVVVDDDTASAERLETMLSEARLAVRRVSEHEVENALTAPAGATGIIVAPRAPLAYVRQLRDNRRLGFVHVVYASAAVSPADVMRAFEAGVDEFVRKPWQADEVAARLAGRFHAMDRAAQVHAQAVAADRLRRHTGLSVQALAITDTNTFRNAAEAVQQTLRDFTGLPIDVRQRVAQPADWGALVKLVDVEQELEVGAAVSADGENCAALCRAFLGEGTDEPAFFDDVVREVANMMMATLKTSFVDDGLALTSGVPETRGPEDIREALISYPARKTLVASGETFEFLVFIGVCMRPVMLRPVVEVCEGMVLAQDVEDADGVLTARAGTRITQGIATRIQAALPGNEVRVADPRMLCA